MRRFVLLGVIPVIVLFAPGTLGPAPRSVAQDATPHAAAQCPAPGEALAAGTPGSRPEAGFSAAERAYIDEMTPIVATVQASLGRYKELSRAPQWLNPSWLLKAGFEFMLWRSADEDVLALAPPPAFAASHDCYLEALGLLAATTDDVRAAADAGDLVGLMQLDAKITRATRLFDQATALMEGVVTARSGLGPAASPATGTSGSGPAASPTPATPVAGPVNVIVEVNTFVGLGSLSTGEHIIQVEGTRACPGGDTP